MTDWFLLEIVDIHVLFVIRGRARSKRHLFDIYIFIYLFIEMFFFWRPSL